MDTRMYIDNGPMLHAEGKDIQKCKGHYSNKVSAEKQHNKTVFIGFLKIHIKTKLTTIIKAYRKNHFITQKNPKTNFKSGFKLTYFVRFFYTYKNTLV